MTKRTDQDALARKLKAQGLAQTPEFSPLLHERVMAGLRALESAQAHEDSAGRSWRVVRVGLGFAAAAAIGVAAWVALKPSTLPEQRAPEIVQNQDVAPPTLVTPVQQLLGGAKTLEEGKYGYLDRDAQRLAIFVADQLPTFGAGSGNGNADHK